MGNFQDSVLFRYFFFHWLFRDASVAELYQRSAAVAHNRANRHHLLTYLRRWLAVASLMYCVGVLLEQLNSMACVFFYTVAALGACTIAKITVAWVFLGK